MSEIGDQFGGNVNALWAIRMDMLLQRLQKHKPIKLKNDTISV